MAALRILWERGPSTVREVADAINAQRDKARRPRLAYTTFLTVLRHMAMRRIASRAFVGKHQRAHAYKAAKTRPAFLRELAKEFLAENFDGEIAKMAEALNG